MLVPTLFGDLAYANFYLQVPGTGDQMPAQTSAMTTARSGDSSGASVPARPGSAPDGTSADRWQAGQVPSAEEFLWRYGDAIDDRVAEILDERDTVRPRSRPSPGFAAIALLLAVAATLVLRQDAVAVCAVWLSTAAVCLAARATRPGRR
jgi:hypothetical protein